MGMFSLAPSNTEGIIVNVAPTQFGDYNLASKNVSAPTEVECGVNKDPEGEKQMHSLAPSCKGVTIVNMVSKQHRDYNLVSKNLSVLTRAKYIKTHKIKGHKIIKEGIFKEKIDSARVGQAKRGKIKNKKIGAPHPSPGNTKRTKFRVIHPYPRPAYKDTIADASKEGAVGKEEVEVQYIVPVLKGKETKATLENLQPWPNESCESGGLGGGHSDDQFPLPTTQPCVCGGGSYTTSPQESDNHRQVQSKQRGVTTSPQESENHRQAQ